MHSVHFGNEHSFHTHSCLNQIPPISTMFWTASTHTRSYSTHTFAPRSIVNHSKASRISNPHFSVAMRLGAVTNPNFNCRNRAVTDGCPFYNHPHVNESRTMWSRAQPCYGKICPFITASHMPYTIYTSQWFPSFRRDCVCVCISCP